MEKEIWKDVIGYENLYKISNLGIVKSFHNKEKILKPFLNEFGYFIVDLYKEKKRKKYKIHQLVAMCFLSHMPNGHDIVVDHINNIKTDNRLENIQLISNRDNVLKDKKNGTSIYHGVCWNVSNKKWESKFRIKNKRIHLGYYHEEKLASEMYNLAIKNIEKYDGDNKIFRDFLKKIKSEIIEK